MIRNSVRATYDSRETGPKYHVTATIDGRPLVFRHRIPDPFVRQTVYVCWWDLLRGLLKRRLVVEVTVGGDPEVVNDVLELDEDTVIPGRTREEAFRRHINVALANLAEDE